MQKLIVVLSLLFVITACNPKQPNQSDSSTNETSETTTQEPEPIWGYRYTLEGDFNGDGKKETLKEHFVSTISGEETNKFYKGLDDYEQLIELTIAKQPWSFLTCDNANIDTLHIAELSQLLGVYILRNEGDLDGDGGEEISYVVDWADFSNINSCNVMSYKNNKWVELYDIPIWETQLPGLPIDSANHNPTSSGAKSNSDLALEEFIKEQVKLFDGFIKLQEPGIIQIRFRNNEAEEDTMLVDLLSRKQ